MVRTCTVFWLYLTIFWNQKILKYFVSFAKTSKDAMTFKIFTRDKKSVFTKNVVKPASDLNNMNKKVTFDQQTEAKFKQIRAKLEAVAIINKKQQNN